MKRTREEVVADLIELLPTLGEEAFRWGVPDEITEHTLLRDDLDWSSIEVVILANAIQERYGRVLPFLDWFQELGREGRQDISLGDWADFVVARLNQDQGPLAATGS